MGVVATESCRGVVAVGIFDRDRAGLKSCRLFFLDLVVDERLVLPFLVGCLAGEESLEARGDTVIEVDVHAHFEGWVSTFALEVAEDSGSTEFRLEMLASKPDTVPDLSMMMVDVESERI